MIDPIIPQLWAPEMERVLRSQQAHSAFNAWREAMHREWMALPWYVRAWRKTKSRMRAIRRRLGEIIAGERFDD